MQAPVLQPNLQSTDMLPPAHRCSAVSSDTVPQAVAALPAKVGRSASFSSHSAARPSGQNLHQLTALKARD